jgi:hypothetical protein
MSPHSRVRRPSTFHKTIAAAAAAAVSFGLLVGVVTMFSHEGMPLEAAAVAERACSDHVFVSDRTKCVDAFLANAQRHTIARH